MTQIDRRLSCDNPSRQHVYEVTLFKTYGGVGPSPLQTHWNESLAPMSFNLQAIHTQRAACGGTCLDSPQSYIGHICACPMQQEPLLALQEGA